MLKPDTYPHTYVVAQDILSSAIPVRSRIAPALQGILHTGRAISLLSECAVTNVEVRVSAYSEGLGLVRVNSRWLNRMR